MASIFPSFYIFLPKFSAIFLQFENYRISRGLVVISKKHTHVLIVIIKTKVL